MDWLQAVVEVLKAGAWPLVIGGALFYFRRPVKELLEALPAAVQKLESIKAAGIEIALKKAELAIAEGTKAVEALSAPEVPAEAKGRIAAHARESADMAISALNLARRPSLDVLGAHLEPESFLPFHDMRGGLPASEYGEVKRRIMRTIVGLVGPANVRLYSQAGDLEAIRKRVHRAIYEIIAGHHRRLGVNGSSITALAGAGFVLGLEMTDEGLQEVIKIAEAMA